MIYQLNEGTLDIPAGWGDESINIFTLPDGGGASLVVTRGRLQPGETVETAVDAQLVRMRRDLKGYELLDRRPIQTETMICGLLQARWVRDSALVEQLVMYAPSAEGHLLVMTGTAPAPMSTRHRQMLLQSMATFTPKAPAATMAPPPASPAPSRQH